MILFFRGFGGSFISNIHPRSYSFLRAFGAPFRLVGVRPTIISQSPLTSPPLVFLRNTYRLVVSL